MTYIQLKARTTLKPGEKILLHHVADVFGEWQKDLSDLPVDCPDTPGVWRLPALSVIKAIGTDRGEITVLGPPECFVHIVPRDKREKTHLIRTVFAFLLLMIGSAFAITWFHADVNMLEAQQGIYRMFTGHEAENTFYLTIPYAVGVFFGVSLFYALLGKQDTISPLDIKLREYQKSAEKEMGKNP